MIYRFFFKQPSPIRMLIFSAVLLLCTACDEALPPVITETINRLDLTPWETYLAALNSGGLADTRMVQAWEQAGTRALNDSVLLELPFQETGYFRAETPEALAYRIELKTGELLQIDLQSIPGDVLFFADIFQFTATGGRTDLRHLFNAENYRTDSLSFEAPETGSYLLRIQPELLVAGRYNLRLIVQPVYGSFPVSGKGNRDVWSFYGDPRDGGRRDHKGIDIFARRGTPVVAAVDGRIRSVRDRGLGGKQVWLSDPQRRQSLYYAHLDSQLVQEGRQVMAGDTLGLVGNTGNARNTRPHLHFGIYRRGSGAIDPYPFVASQTKQTPAVRADTSLLGQSARVKSANTELRAAPETRSTALATLDRYLPVQIVAASKNWYHVRSPKGLSGYLPANSLESTDRAIRKISLSEAMELQLAPDPNATPTAAVSSKATIDLIGIQGNYYLVRDDLGNRGWLSMMDW